MTIGLISDTHGLLRPEALDELRGVSHILHAGDVGQMEIVRRLEELAPVTVVRGNIDERGECAGLPLTAALTVGNIRILVLHDLHDLDPGPGARVVVFGHTHRPLVKETDGVLYVNPGSAGPRRFSLPVSAGRLYVEGETVRAELIALARSAPS